MKFLFFFDLSPINFLSFSSTLLRDQSESGDFISLIRDQVGLSDKKWRLPVFVFAGFFNCYVAWNDSVQGDVNASLARPSYESDGPERLVRKKVCSKAAPVNKRVRANSIMCLCLVCNRSETNQNEWTFLLFFRPHAPSLPQFDFSSKMCNALTNSIRQVHLLKLVCFLSYSDIFCADTTWNKKKTKSTFLLLFCCHPQISVIIIAQFISLFISLISLLHIVCFWPWKSSFWHS